MYQFAGPLEKMYKSPIFNGYSLANHCLPATSRAVTDVSAIQTLMGGAPIKIENTLNSSDFQTQGKIPSREIPSREIMSIYDPSYDFYDF